MSGSRGVPYFYNSDTKTSVWETPDGLTKEEIKELRGAEYLERPVKVRASHLLVKHSGSRNPSSWREVWRSFRSLGPYPPLTVIPRPR
jgi:NIMA-interacting peptidyl-prolyl cis-trans isomerase 1